MEVAHTYGKLSRCNRRQVGALLVSADNRPLLSGYNGTSPNRPNACEDKEGKTVQLVHHAEANLIGNAAKKGISTDKCIMYVTTSPCIDCAKLIEISGISKVFYEEDYHNEDGIAYLKQAGIYIAQIKRENNE
jgi:dCMP deaminase